eukprot:4187808-Amphidinium_carterae.1
MHQPDRFECTTHMRPRVEQVANANRPVLASIMPLHKNTMVTGCRCNRQWCKLRIACANTGSNCAPLVPEVFARAFRYGALVSCCAYGHTHGHTRDEHWSSFVLCHLLRVSHVALRNSAVKGLSQTQWVSPC